MCYSNLKVLTAMIMGVAEESQHGKGNLRIRDDIYSNEMIPNMCSSHISKRAKAGPPVCVYEPNHNMMFRVLHRKGKSFTSGGYGIDSTFATEESIQSQKKLIKTMHKSSPQTTFLFIEEALFLLQRGLLQILHPNGIDSMSSYDLFKLLEDQGVPLPIYLAYAHLRSQSYILLRHIDTQQNEEEEGNYISAFNVSSCDSAVEGCNHSKKSQKLYVRRKRLNAPPPKMFCHEHADECTRKMSPSSNIAFDMFNPNSKFRKSNPGKPDYFITVSYFNGGQQQTPTFHYLMELVQFCQGIPLRLGECVGNFSTPYT